MLRYMANFGDYLTFLAIVTALQRDPCLPLRADIVLARILLIG